MLMYNTRCIFGDNGWITMFDYAGFSDAQLQRLAAAGDRVAEEELVKRYMQLVRACSRHLFLAGGDSEDLIQEGMFGLLSAIKQYDPQNGSSFKTFAEHALTASNKES